MKYQSLKTLARLIRERKVRAFCSFDKEGFMITSKPDGGGDVLFEYFADDYVEVLLRALGVGTKHV